MPTALPSPAPTSLTPLPSPAPTSLTPLPSPNPTPQTPTMIQARFPTLLNNVALQGITVLVFLCLVLALTCLVQRLVRTCCPGSQADKQTHRRATHRAPALKPNRRKSGYARVNAELEDSHEML